MMMKAEARPALHRKEHKRSSTTSTQGTEALKSSHIYSQASSTPVDSHSATSHIEVQVPYVPPYIPTGIVEETLDQLPPSTSPPARCRNGLVTSRFTKQDGLIGFAISFGSGAGEGHDHNDKIYVDLPDIYNYVTPEELERFENVDWEREIELARNKPRVGRPRRTPPALGVLTAVPHRVSGKPIGRPRKRPNDAADRNNVRSRRHWKSRNHFGPDFLGVYIPSPANSDQPTADVLLRSPPAPPNPGSRKSLRQESSPSSAGADSTSATRVSGNQVDQLTPSNANRVVGIKLPQPSPAKSARKASYPMVQAALGDTESSEGDDVQLHSGSEDELTLLPTNHDRHFRAGTEISNSTRNNGGRKGQLFLSAPESLGDQINEDEKGEARGRSLDDEAVLFSDSIEGGPADPDFLPQQLQASNTRRIRSRSPSTTTSSIPPTKIIHRYFMPKAVVKQPAVPTMHGHPPVPAKRNPESPSDDTPRSREPESNQFQRLAVSHAHLSPERRQRPTKVSTNPEPRRLTSKDKPPQDPNASTPKLSRQPRQSMTPHFPSSKRKNGNAGSPRLRGGRSDLPAAMGSPRTLTCSGQISGAMAQTSILEDRDQINALLSNGTDGPFVPGGANVKLGSPLCSSDESHEHVVDNVWPPFSRSPKSSTPDIILGSPMTSCTEGERTRPGKAPPSRKPQMVDVDHEKKRRRLSHGSNEGSRPRYSMVRR